jgi:hypothetical protein
MPSKDVIRKAGWIVAQDRIREKKEARTFTIPSQSSDALHMVTIMPGSGMASCTCTWGQRRSAGNVEGDCSHILAARWMVEHTD